MSHSKNNFGGSIGKEVVIFSTNYLGGFGYSELVKGQFEKMSFLLRTPQPDVFRASFGAASDTLYTMNHARKKLLTNTLSTI